MPLLVYQLLDEMAKRRRSDFEVRSFYELSGKLSNLYTSSALDRAFLRKEHKFKIDEKIKLLEG